MLHSRFVWAVLALLCAACRNTDRASSTWVAEIDTVGDTLVVRTVSGSVWDSVATLAPVFQIGELEGRDVYLFGDIEGLAVDSAGAIWVYDGQVPALRKY